MISAAVLPAMAQWSLFCTVEAPLAGPDLANALEKLVKVVLAEPPTLLQPLVVEYEALDDEFPQRPGSPYAELSRLSAVHPVAYGNDGIEVVEAGQVFLAVRGSCPEIPEN